MKARVATFRAARRRVVAVAVVAMTVLAGLLAVPASAQETRFFRIGTGSTSGTYFPIGTLLAAAISSPPGSRACDEGGSCGVPGLIAVAQATHGSVQNIELISQQQAESGFSQADIAYWAYFGDAMFAEKGPRTRLRALANLYPEMVHVVVRRHTGIFSIPDLAGRKISLGATGSGTAVNADLILSAYGLEQGDYEVVREMPGPSADLLQQGRIDALFIVGGAPYPAVADLARRTDLQLLPIGGKQAENLVADHPFFVPAEIADGIYANVAGVATLSVGAQWLISADLDDDLVYAIARSLWHPSTRRLLESGHPDGRRIKLETALKGIAIPLHDGAARYYREVGLLK
jgi:TRAP transporter TAXI family solute receptor